MALLWDVDVFVEFYVFMKYFNLNVFMNYDGLSSTV